ncbi:MAG: hypothetical protein HC859_13295 [Bacteroidia bacterium]|nr:hypothetical protein [Bacteroidia bacterium]
MTFETKPRHELTIRVKDATGLEASLKLVIHVLDAKEAPKGIGLSNVIVKSNSTAPVFVGTFRTIDPDAGDTHSYEVNGQTPRDNRFIVIDNMLYLTEEPDYDGRAVYTIRVRSTDNTSKYVDRLFSIYVIRSEAELQIAENSPPGTLVGGLRLTAATIASYSIKDGNENGVFALDAMTGVLTVDGPINFEQTQVYDLGIVAVSPLGSSFDVKIRIRILDQNEAPTNISLNGSSVRENATTLPELVGRFATTDEDAGDIHTYQLMAGALDNSAFIIDGNNLYLNETADFETKSSYQVQVRSSDRDGLYIDKAFVISVEDVPEAPVIVGQTITLDENTPNGTTVGIVSVTGSSAIASYRITEGNTRNAFHMDVNNGTITVADQSALDFEKQPGFELKIEVSDVVGLRSVGAMVVQLQDVNEPIIDMVLSNNRINEGSTMNTIVGNFEVLDQDFDDLHLIELVSGVGDTDNHDFRIDGESLSILRNTNYERNPIYHIRIRATDMASHVFEKEFEIIVTDVNENALLFIPTLFSPNADGGNDRFFIQSEEVDVIAFAIYSPVHGVVFETHDASEATSTGWDGTFKGQALPPGTYLWKMEGRFKNGGELTFKGSKIGSITLIR